MPALRALRLAGGPVTLAAQPRIGRLLRELGVVDRAVDFDALGLAALFRREARAPGLDAGGLTEERLTPLARFTRVVSWFGARDPDFVARLGALAPGAIIAAPYAAGGPVWEHLLATLGRSPGEADVLRESIVVSPPLVEKGRRALGRAGWDGSTPLVLVHPGAGGIAKRWPAEGFAGVLGRVAARGRIAVALHEGPADHEAVTELVARLEGLSIRLTEPPLPTLAGMLPAATAYLGNDSGVSHLAAAVGAAAAVLFTRDKLEWRPWALDAEPLVVETSGLVPGDIERVAAALGRLVG